MRFSTFSMDKHGVDYNEKKRSGVWDKKQDTKVNDVVHRQGTGRKYCRFKKLGIKYVDYKNTDILMRFLNDQGKIALSIKRSCLER